MSDIDTRLDKIATLNKMAHPELDGACYICGINPSLLKQLMADEFEKMIGDDEYLTDGDDAGTANEAQNTRNVLRRNLRNQLKEWKQ